MSKEIWKDIPGFEGYYQASDLGRIRSMTRTIKCTSPRSKNPVYRKIKGQILNTKNRKSNRGYYSAKLSKADHHFYYTVHRLVAYTFLGYPSKSNWIVSHKNGRKTDNRAKNLRWITPAEHTQNTYDSGKKSQPLGGDSPNAKLTKSQVDSIRNKFKIGLHVNQIALEYNVSASAIRKIRENITWKTASKSKLEEGLKRLYEQVK